MNEEAPRPLALVRTAEDQLDAAVEAASRGILSVLQQENEPLDEAAATLQAIAAAVRGALDDPVSGASFAPLRADPLCEPFLAAVATALIHGTGADEAARSTLRALRAVSAVRGAGVAPATRIDTDDLRSRLRAPDAFELLLEVAHDFRSPLTSILFLSETLRDGNSGDVSELQHSQLGLIYSAAFGLASVASDVVDLARRERDIIDEETQPYRIVEVFETVHRLVSPIVEEKGLELRIVAPEVARAHGHPHALARVLLNLTTNALKFTDTGWVEMGVVQMATSHLEYYVQDTGRGIPEDRIPELFKPFKRRLGENQEGHFFSGSGVGLSIARRLVRAMGSDLDVKSSDVHGTRFCFTVTGAPPGRP